MREENGELNCVTHHCPAHFDGVLASDFPNPRAEEAGGREEGECSEGSDDWDYADFEAGSGSGSGRAGADDG